MSVPHTQLCLLHQQLVKKEIKAHRKPAVLELLEPELLQVRLRTEQNITGAQQFKTKGKAFVIFRVKS